MSVGVDAPARTVAEVVSAMAHRLTEAGVSNSSIEAKEIVARALRVNRKCLDLRRNDRWSVLSQPMLDSLFLQRVARIPLAYLLGEWDFMDMTLTVTPDVLIPRPETEELFDWLSRAPNGPGGPDRSHFSPSSVADVGTGAGGLALAMARQWPSARVTAIDLSVAALAVARWNARRHGVEDRIEFRLNDLLEGTDENSFDLVVANLPYVATPDMAGLSPEVLKEPRRALEGGPDGLSVIRRFIPQAFGGLRRGGAALS